MLWPEYCATRPTAVSPNPPLPLLASFTLNNIFFRYIGRHGSVLRQAGLTQAGKKSRFEHCFSCRRDKIFLAGGPLRGDARRRPVAVEPAGFGKLGGSTRQIALEAIG